MTLDMKKLVTVMRQTEKDNDNEALVAIRMANQMLKAAGKHWGDVLRSPTFAASHSLLDELAVHMKRTGGRDEFEGGVRGFARKYGAPASSMRDHQRHKQASKEQVRGPDIDRMLATLRGRQHEMSFLMFLASVTKFYGDKGYLTRPQYDAVKKAYERK